MPDGDRREWVRDRGVISSRLRSGTDHQFVYTKLVDVGYIYGPAIMTLDGFDWDEGNRGKCQKHGVSIREIESLFEETPLVGPDPNHSDFELRFRAIGRVERRGLFVVFTLRTSGTDRLIRPISARYMHKREIDAYEKEVSRAED